MIHVPDRILSSPFLRAEVERGERGLPEDLRLRCIPVEDSGDLLERTALGLWEEEVDGRDHSCQGADVNEVELPGDGLECDWITELVEDWNDVLALMTIVRFQ